MLRRYGVSIADFERLLEAQGFRCAICGIVWQDCKPAKRVRHEGHFLQHLCVDHDHRTAIVRGLLCNACNTAIGLFLDDERALVCTTLLAHTASNADTVDTAGIAYDTVLKAVSTADPPLRKGTSTRILRPA